MKKILISLFFLSLIILGSTGVAYAWFSAQGKVRGINISVAGSGLLINGENEWMSGANFENIFPGWNSELIAVEIFNVSDSNLPLGIEARVLFTGVDFEVLADTMLMAMEKEGSLETPEFQTLAWWSESGHFLGSLAGGESQNYNLWFKLPSTAGDEIQNTILTVNVLLTGTQVF